MSEIAKRGAEKHTVTTRWISGVEPAPELLKATGTEILELECREQPKRLAELIEHYAADDAVHDAMRALREAVAGPGPVLFLGMGGSLCSAYSGSALLQSHGRMAFSLDAGEWLHYAASTWDQAALSMVLTTSGESAEIVGLFRIGAERPMALICNNAASRCWEMAKTRLPILAGPEYGNATKTYTNAAAAAIIAASEMLGVAWKEDADRAL